MSKVYRTNMTAGDGTALEFWAFNDSGIGCARDHAEMVGNGYDVQVHATTQVAKADAPHEGNFGKYLVADRGWRERYEPRTTAEANAARYVQEASDVMGDGLKLRELLQTQRKALESTRRMDYTRTFTSGENGLSTSYVRLALDEIREKQRAAAELMQKAADLAMHFQICVNCKDGGDIQTNRDSRDGAPYTVWCERCGASSADRKGNPMLRLEDGEEF